MPAEQPKAGYETQKVDVTYIRTIVTGSIQREISTLHAILDDPEALRDFNYVDRHMAKLKASIRSLDVLDGVLPASTAVYTPPVPGETVEAVERALFPDEDKEDDAALERIARSLAPNRS